MKAILAGELQRLVSRRLVRVLLLLSVLGIALAGVLTFLNTEDTDPASPAARQQQVQEQIRRCQQEAPDFQPEVEPGRPDPACFGSIVMQNPRDKRLPLVDFKGVFQGMTAPLVIMAWLIGASAIGAEWQNRSITTLLTWEPRRVRVLVVKATAAALVAVALALVVQALLAAALLPSVVAHGTTAGADADWVRSLLGVLGRGSAMVAIASVIGFALASVGRNTSAAMGVGFAYIVVVENVVGQFLQDWRRWLILGNVIVFVSGHGGDDGVPGRSVLGAGMFLTAVSLGLLAVAAAAFRRRDVA